MRELKLKAMAKVNLGLDVLRKREDGYHELRMIMQSIYLYDRIEIRRSEEKGIRVFTNLYYLPTGPENLVYRGAELLMKEFQIQSGLEIRLEKHIPVAAGLAGGSSDAAAVLLGVNRIFGLGLSREELMERGVKLGADIPFCIMRGTVLAEGIGEKLTKLPGAPSCQVLLAKPKIHVSTKSVYGALQAEKLPFHPDIDGQIQFHPAGRPVWDGRENGKCAGDSDHTEVSGNPGSEGRHGEDGSAESHDERKRSYGFRSV